MELKPGYKQTEVGVIPEDWDIIKLGDFTLKVGSGVTPKGGATVYKQFGRPFMRSQNVGWGVLKLDDIAFIDDQIHNTFSDTELKKNDVLLNITGASIGRCALATNEVVGGNVNQHVCIIRTNDHLLSPTYLSRVLLSDIGQRQIDSFQAGGNREGLNFGQIKSFNIPLPPTKAEQTAIANALSDADALIQSLTRLIAKKRQIKQAAMQILLNPYENGWLKEGWVVKKIGSFTDATAGGTPSTLVDEYWGGDIKWMSSGELNKKRVYDVLGRITEEGLKNSATKIITTKCVLIGLAGQGKTRGTVAMNFVELCTNQSIAAIFPCTTVSTEFLYFNLDVRYEELRNLSTGDGGRGGLNLRIIKNLDVWMPKKLEEQLRIATVLSDMDTEIAALETKLTKYQHIKQGMMQNLLTGRIRLI